MLHKGHCGYEKTLRLAKSMYYWPGMNNSVKQTCEACRQCLERSPTQPVENPVEPLRNLNDLFPMSDVGIDLFNLRGTEYIVMVDRFSNKLFCHRLHSTSTKSVTNILLAWFHAFGFPLRIRSDFGPQFRGPFRDFCSSFNIHHEVSSAYNPRSNGLSESGVKAVKRLLDKCIDNKENFDSALMHYNNTPFSGKSGRSGASPNALFFHRILRTQLPSTSLHLRPLSTSQIHQFIEDRAASHEQVRDQQQQHPSYEQLRTGDSVYLQDPHSKRWDERGIISDIRESGRSYDVRLSSGKLTTRNRRFLKPASPHAFQASLSPAAKKQVRGFMLPNGQVLSTFMQQEEHSLAISSVARAFFASLHSTPVRTHHVFSINMGGSSSSEPEPENEIIQNRVSANQLNEEKEGFTMFNFHNSSTICTCAGLMALGAAAGAGYFCAHHLQKKKHKRTRGELDRLRAATERALAGIPPLPHLPPVHGEPGSVALFPADQYAAWQRSGAVPGRAVTVEPGPRYPPGQIVELPQHEPPPQVPPRSEAIPVATVASLLSHSTAVLPSGGGFRGARSGTSSGRPPIPPRGRDVRRGGRDCDDDEDSPTLD